MRRAGLTVAAPSQSAQKVNVYRGEECLFRFAKTPRNPGTEVGRVRQKLRRAGVEVPGFTDRR